MNNRLKFYLELFLSVSVAIMIFATDMDRTFRFIIPGTVIALIVLFTFLYFSDFGISCGDYIISKRNYYKKKKKKNAGEQADSGCFTTNAELSKLPSEYIVICKYHKQTFKMDNIVIGPSGIYLIDSNSVGGAIDKVLSVLMLNENLSMVGCLKDILEKLKIVSELVKSNNVLKKALKPALCFTNARVNLQPDEHADGVLVVSLKNLMGNISKAPVILETSDIRSACALILDGAEYASCRKN